MKIPGMDALPGNDAGAATVAVGGVLNDPERPMKERFRALFTLRNIGGEEAVNQVHSRLLTAPVGYCEWQRCGFYICNCIYTVVE